jgi:hypothetical protein
MTENLKDTAVKVGDNVRYIGLTTNGPLKPGNVYVVIGISYADHRTIIADKDENRMIVHSSNIVKA